MADCLRIKIMSKIMGWDKPKLPLEKPCYKHYWETKNVEKSINRQICCWQGRIISKNNLKVGNNKQLNS